MTPQPPQVQTTASPPIPGGFAAVVVAAGSGTRLGQGIPKALVRVGDRTILEHCLTGLAASGVTAADADWAEGPVVVTVPAGDSLLTEVARDQGTIPVAGGSDRAGSVRNALDHLRALGHRPRGVLVHDAARCLTPTTVFARVARALADGQDAVIPVLPVVDTVRAVDLEGACTGVVDRSGLRAVQTPQGFSWDLLLAVNEAAADHPDVSVTDDASLVEQFSDSPVHTVAGDDAALKITRPLDLVLAEALLNRTLNRTESRP